MNTTISNSEKLSLISNIGTMLEAGIPILEVVDSMLEETKGGQKIILENLKADLNQGKTIANSFEKFPKVFNPVIINLIRAAEESGTLDATLKDITENIKKEAEFSDKIKAALVYPLLVVVIFLGVFLLILTFVIPRVSTIFDRLRVNLPLPTKILIVISKTFLAHTAIIIAGIIVLVVGLFFLYKIKRRLILDAFFTLPLISKLMKEIDLTRLSRNMSLLLASGIPITQALELSQNVVTKKEVRRVVGECKRLVSSGKKLSEGFKKEKGVIPSMMIRITEAGEKSGTLEKSMQNLAEYFDSQVSNHLKTLATLFEPVLLIVIGILVGGVMLAIIAPIYGLISQITTR